MQSKKRFSLGSVFRIALGVVSVGLIIFGLYLLLILYLPKYYHYIKHPNATITSQNKVLIEKQGIDTNIYEGSVEVLEKGAWHQYPERGNPQDGGNFILAAHSFLWGYTPWQVMNKSFFYNLDEVEVGDEVVVHWNSKAYYYLVDKKFQIQPNDTAILEPSGEAKLTLYTCTEGGSADGRVVVVAKPKN